MKMKKEVERVFLNFRFLLRNSAAPREYSYFGINYKHSIKSSKSFREILILRQSGVFIPLFSGYHCKIKEGYFVLKKEGLKMDRRYVRTMD